MAVPEGLPLAVTISLAYSMMKMMADQNLVRHLVACETMGGATQICSDKTGTLTQNKMTVTNVVLSGGASFDLNQHGPTKVAEFASGLNPELSRLFAQNISVNSSALVLEQNGKKVVSGSASEIALIEFLQKMNVDPAKIRKDEAENILRGFPFSSSKKRMSTLMKAGKKDAILIVKGASEVVLAQCVNDYANGKESALTDAKRAEVTHQIEQWAKRGLRTLTFAYRRIPLPDDVSTLEDGELDEQLTYIGVVGIKDPVRPEVPQAVQDCAKAGIKVRMLTGDNILTAKDIALQCKILTDDGDEERCLEGPVFRKMSDRAVNKILPKLEVMARCSPEDKLRLVKLLRAKGEVVAVTGDGTNDAPQLNEADVGFAMGIAGTEVAKQASDIILLDDNFNSILKAVLWGRNVFLSIKKFIQFQLTVNIAAVFIGLLGAMTTGSTPLKAVQLLWVNLIMDTFAALALATDPPTRRLLDQPPYGRFASLITRKMWVCIIGQAIFQLALLVFLLFADMSKVSMLHVPATLSTHDAEGVRNSLIFNVFVFCQLFNEFNCRKIESEESIFQGLFSNKIFVFIMGFSVTVQVLLIQYGGDFVHCVPLNSAQWLFTLCAASISIPLGALLRGIDLKEYQAPKIDNTERARQGWKYARQVLTQVSVANAFKATLSESKEGTSASSTASGSPNKIDGEEERPNITKSLKKQKRRGSANITS